MISENLSKANFSAVNSSRKGLYFSSDGNVRLDAKAIGCRWVTSFPPGSVVLILCDNTPAKVSLLLSVVKINGVPSYLGAERTSSEMSHALRAMNVFVCSVFQLSSSLKALMIC